MSEMVTLFRHFVLAQAQRSIPGQYIEKALDPVLVFIRRTINLFENVGVVFVSADYK